MNLDFIFKHFKPVAKDPESEKDYLFSDGGFYGDIPDNIELGFNMSWPISQGNLGSCVGCAGTHIMQYWDNLKRGDRESNLSEQYLYWECEKIDDHPAMGTYPKFAMQVLKKKGIPVDAAWPYVPKQYHGTLPQPWADEDAATRKIQSYHRIMTLKQLLVALFEIGPVLCSLEIFNYWLKPNPFLITEKNGFSLGNHAICLCGYDIPSRRIRFVNSWGWLWADSGSAWISFDYFEKFMVDCWVPTPLNERE